MRELSNFQISSRNFSKFYEDNEKSIFIIYVTLFAGAIFLRPYIHPGKLMIIDSEIYLEIAKQVINGTFFSKFWSRDASLYWYWPMGYPFSIGVIGWMIGGNVFLASRVLHLLFFLFSVYLIMKFFPNDGRFYTYLIGTGAFLGMYIHTLSEAGFLFFCLAFLYAFLNRKNEWWLILLFSYCVFLFRHTGVFLLLFFILFYFLVERQRSLIKVGLFLSAGIVLYLYKESLANGSITNIDNLDPKIGRLTMIGLYLSGIIQSFSFYDVAHFGGSVGKILFWLGLIPMVLMGILWFKTKQETFKPANRIQKTFFYFGISYFITFLMIISVTGWDHQGWGVDMRYIIPGSIFIWIGLFDYYKPDNGFPFHVKMIFTIAAFSVVVYSGYVQALIDHYGA